MRTYFIIAKYSWLGAVQNQKVLIGKKILKIYPNSYFRQCWSENNSGTWDMLDYTIPLNLP